jgi:SAM-dependent methyltransferase
LKIEKGVAMENIIDSILDKIDVIKKNMFSDEKRIYREVIINGREDFERLVEENPDFQKFDDIINDVGISTEEHGFLYRAYCSVCGKDQTMYYSAMEISKMLELGHTNVFREGFFCPECHCNSRLRVMIQKMRKEYNRGMKVYLYEKITPTYQAVSQFIPEDDLTGSEYFGSEHKSGEYIDGILHEDAAALSFADNSFDLMLSMDVFEHTYYYEKVFKEAYRVLKPGGKFLLTIPMRPAYDKTIERAKIVDGEVVHILEPIMHGDPMDPGGGALEFIQYGWDIIPFMKSIGFQQVTTKAYYSINDGYLGCFNFYFELIK